MKITHILITTLFLLGCCDLHAMEQNDEKSTQQEAQLKKRKEFESKLESAKKWGKWRAEAYAGKMNMPQSQEVIEVPAHQAIPLPRIAAQCAHITKYDDYTDDNDTYPTEDDDPFIQYLNGKRDDLEAILAEADRRDKESRSVKNNVPGKKETLPAVRAVSEGEDDDDDDYQDAQ